MGYTIPAECTGAPGDLPFKRTGLDAAGGVVQTDWMTHIVLFPSVLGMRQGAHDAAQVLREVGHEVLVVDLYGGRVFDDYNEASTYEESIGYPELMRRAGEAVEAVPDGFIAAGFSNRAAWAEYFVTKAACSGHTIHEVGETPANARPVHGRGE